MRKKKRRIRLHRAPAGSAWAPQIRPPPALGRPPSPPRSEVEGEPMPVASAASSRRRGRAPRGADARRIRRLVAPTRERRSAGRERRFGGELDAAASARERRSAGVRSAAFARLARPAPHPSSRSGLGGGWGHARCGVWWKSKVPTDASTGRSKGERGVEYEFYTVIATKN
uniref:Uncharacterized protein n=1 Tax=Arundo donax TaxID=35708 RepID=A0A0A9CRW4_ARUDO